MRIRAVHAWNLRDEHEAGRVDRAGDATITLSQQDRELWDEADRIYADGKPVDVKTTASTLEVQACTPGSHTAAINQVDTFRRLWQDYVNGPATSGRGRFDTSLNPTTY